MRKHLFILSAILLSSLTFLSAQVTFQKIFGGTNWEVGRSVQQTTDGGYIIAGTTQSFGAGGTDVYLIKIDVYGTVTWTKTFGEAGYDIANSLQQTSDGGYIISGHTYSFGAGNTDAYLIKTAANGNLLWSKTFGSMYEEKGNSVKQTTDGGYIIAGSAYIAGPDNFDVYLIKADSNGDTLWTKTFGGIEHETGASIEQTADDGFIIAGSTNSFGSGDNDIYLIKTDVIGDTLWTRTYGGTNSDISSTVHQTTDGGYIIAGGTSNFGLGNNGVVLIRTDSGGIPVWTKTYGGGTFDGASSVQQTSDGGYIILGSALVSSVKDVYLIKTDVNGDTLWTKTYGSASDEGGSSVQQTSDGGYILVGGAFVGSFNRVYLIKTDSLGNSGCNQGNTTTLVASASIQMTTPATIVGSANAIVSSPATLVYSGVSVTTLCTSVGVNDINIDNSFNISPNPSNGNFIISFEGMIKNGNIEIVNILGEKVYTENIFNDSKKEINLVNISGGIYFVKIVDGETHYCRKIIVERD